MSKTNLNKTELKKQQETLASYQKFLPLLELKKEQLQSESRKLQKEYVKQNVKLKSLLDELKKYYPLFSQVDLSRFLSRSKINTKQSNFCGIQVTKLIDLDTPIIPYQLDDSPPWLEMLLQKTIEYKKLFICNSYLKNEFLLIQYEHSKISQRVNLFASVLIPRAKGKIKKIKIFLDDQQTASVVRSKKCKELAKRRKL